MLVVISTSFKADYCLIYERGSQAVSFYYYFLIIVSSFIKIVWKADKRFFSIEKYERSGKKLKVRIYWFQGVTKSFNLEKIG